MPPAPSPVRGRAARARSARRLGRASSFVAVVAAVGAAAAAAEGGSSASLATSAREDRLFAVPSLYEEDDVSFSVVTVRGADAHSLFPGGEPGLVVHLDGVPIARPTMALGSTFDLASVRVLPGPQGTQGGKAATGGWLELRPNPPAPEREVLGHFALGSYDRYVWRAVVNEPLAGEKLMLRWTARFEDRDGYQRTLARVTNDLPNPAGFASSRPALRSDAWGDAHDLLSRVQLRSLPTEGLELHATGQYAFRRGNGPALALLNEPTLLTQFGCVVGLDGCGIGFNRFARTSRNVRTTYRSFRGAQDYEQAFAMLRATHRAPDDVLPSIGGLELRGQLAFHRTDASVSYDADLTDANAYVERVRELADQYSLEVSAGSAAERPRAWRVGVFAWKETATLLGENIAASLSPFEPADVLDELETTSVAGFARAEVWLADAWMLAAGARVSRDETEARERSAGLAPIEAERAETTGTFDATAAWEWRAGSRTGFRFAVGSRPGGFDTGVPEVAGAPAQLRDHGDERALHYEWFAENALWNERVTFDLRLFWTDYERYLLCLDSGFGHRCSNGGGALARGVEVGVRVRPAVGALVQLTATRLDAELDDHRAVDRSQPRFIPGTTVQNPLFGVQIDLDGRPLLRAPRWQVGALARWELDASWIGAPWLGALTLSVDLLYQSRTAHRVFDPQRLQRPTLLVGSSLRWSSESRRWHVIAFVHNWLDHDKIALVHTTSSQSVARADYAPRTAGLRFELTH